MAAMAALGLTFALATQKVRRQRDNLPVPPDEAQQVIPTEPARLPALGYLPPDTNVVAAVHVAELLDNPTAGDWLTRLRLTTPGSFLTLLPKWTGFPLEDLDHALLGVQLDDRLVPRVTLVVQTRLPYDPEKICAALHATRRAERGKRLLYRFKLDQTPFEAALWFADERTLVVGLTPEDLDEVPRQPTSGVGHLPLPLQRLLRERLGLGTPIWVVGHVEDWEKTPVRLFSEGWPKEYREALAVVRTFGLWLRFKNDVTLTGAFDCADAGAAEKVIELLARKGEGKKLLARAVGNQPEAGAIVKELAQTLTSRREGSWILAEARADLSRAASKAPDQK
jgi:hypothetical protein